MSDKIYQCQMANCGYLYNPVKGDKKGKVPPNTEFEQLSEEWKCPVCGASKKSFKPIN